MQTLAKLIAFLRRDFLTQVSYRLAFLLQIVGLLFSLAAFYFMSKMIDPDAAGLNGTLPHEGRSRKYATIAASTSSAAQ